MKTQNQNRLKKELARLQSKEKHSQRRYAMLADEDFYWATRNGSGISREVYEKSREIAEIQGRMLEIESFLGIASNGDRAEFENWYGTLERYQEMQASEKANQDKREQQLRMSRDEIRRAYTANISVFQMIRHPLVYKEIKAIANPDNWDIYKMNALYLHQRAPFNPRDSSQSAEVKMAIRKLASYWKEGGSYVSTAENGVVTSLAQKVSKKELEELLHEKIYQEGALVGHFTRNHQTLSDLTKTDSTTFFSKIPGHLNLMHLTY